LTQGKARQVDCEKRFGKGRDAWEKTGEHFTRDLLGLAILIAAAKDLLDETLIKLELGENLLIFPGSAGTTLP